MLVSGHNISTTEVESALVGHPAVAEAAVVGKTDPMSGQAIGAFVILRAGFEPSDELGAEFRDHVAHAIGPIAKPKTVLFTEELPEDPFGQDHASAAPQRRRRRSARRHHHAGRPFGGRGHQAALPLVGPAGRRMSTNPIVTPDHWTWRAGAVEPGPATVVDIDGVLSDAVNRQHYIEAPRRDWKSFFEACGDDEVIEEVKVLLDLLDPALRIVLLTARPGRVHHLTEAWLTRYEIRWDLLIMRPWGDYDMARGVQAVEHLGPPPATASISASASKTTVATSTCCAERASRPSTSTPATTTAQVEPLRRLTARTSVRRPASAGSTLRLRFPARFSPSAGNAGPSLVVVQGR